MEGYIMNNIVEIKKGSKIIISEKDGFRNNQEQETTNVVSCYFIRKSGKEKLCSSFSLEGAACEILGWDDSQYQDVCFEDCPQAAEEFDKAIKIVKEQEQVEFVLVEDNDEEWEELGRDFPKPRYIIPNDLRGSLKKLSPQVNCGELIKFVTKFIWSQFRTEIQNGLYDIGKINIVYGEETNCDNWKEVVTKILK